MAAADAKQLMEVMQTLIRQSISAQSSSNEEVLGQVVLVKNDLEELVWRQNIKIEELAGRLGDADLRLANLQTMTDRGGNFVERVDLIEDSVAEGALRSGDRIAGLSSRIRVLELASSAVMNKSAAPTEGDIVYVDGLKSDLYNRRFGSICGFDSTSGRFLVSFWHDLEPNKFLLQNLQVGMKCPRCESCLGGRTYCGACNFGSLDGGLSLLPRPEPNCIR